MKKILITGPECTGKTTLAQELSRFYGSPYVPEYSRHYLTKIGRGYEEHDLLIIAKNQVKQEEEAMNEIKPVTFLDTSLLVIKIWSEYKYGKCNEWIEKEWKKRKYDLILLCKPDIEWEYDPLRETPQFRDKIYEAFRKYLKDSNRNYKVISGQGNVRMEKGVRYVQKAFLG